MFRFHDRSTAVTASPESHNSGSVYDLQRGWRTNGTLPPHGTKSQQIEEVACRFQPG